nr:Chain P, Agonist peptide [synthetic construct]
TNYLFSPNGPIARAW